MKRLFALILCLSLALSLSSCLGVFLKEGTETDGIAEAKHEVMPTVTSPSEYELYTSVTDKNGGAGYVGQEFIKKGTFAILRDSYNGTQRYFVWGYNDETKRLDWQWEFVPRDASALPAVGSLVEVTGTFGKTDAALYGYRIEDAEVEVMTPFIGHGEELDLTCMSDTLERVQILNIQAFPDEYDKLTVRAYGRIATPTSIEDPYYPNSWTEAFRTSDAVPAVGTMVVLDGILSGGVITECTVHSTVQY